MKHFLPLELATGQLVIVIARWLLVLVALLVAVWNPDPLPQLRLQIGVILLVAIANFLMHAQLLRKRPTLEAVAYAASIGDLLVITLLVGAQGGYGSNIFVFYFPAILAVSVAFPTMGAALLSGLGIGLAMAVSVIRADDLLPLIPRMLSLIATAVIGNAYWRLHRDRIQASVNTRQEAVSDVFWGQITAIWARWAIVLVGAALVLSQAADPGQLAAGILPVIVVLGLNFYLHGRYLVERPANGGLVLIASGIDIAMLAALFFSWHGAAGLGNPYFLLFYPVIFSAGLVFPPRLSWPLTAGCLAVYSLVALPITDLKVLVVRLITMAAVCGLASFYWRSVRRQLPKEVDAGGIAQLAWQSARAG